MDDERVPLRTHSSTAVEGRGWRLILGTVRTAVTVRGLAEATQVAQVAAEAAGAAGDAALEVSLHGGRVGLAVQTRALDAVTERDLALVHRVSDALTTRGWRTVPDDRVQLPDDVAGPGSLTTSTRGAGPTREAEPVPARSPAPRAAEAVPAAGAICPEAALLCDRGHLLRGALTDSAQETVTAGKGVAPMVDA